MSLALILELMRVQKDDSSSEEEEEEEEDDDDEQEEDEEEDEDDPVDDELRDHLLPGGRGTARTNAGVGGSGRDEGEEEEKRGDGGGGGEGADGRLKGKAKRRGQGTAGGEGADGEGEGSTTTRGNKARKIGKKKEEVQIAIDAIIEKDCRYHPSPWSKRQRRTSANTMDMLRARQQGFNIRRPLSAPLGKTYIPNAMTRPLGPSEQKMFCGRFSTSGDVLLTASQDAEIKLYDSQSVYQWSAKPRDPDIDYRAEFPEAAYHMFRHSRSFSRSRSSSGGANKRAWEGAPQPLKTIRCRHIQWSVISTDFSPDEKWLAYSSWSPFVHLCNTRGDYELHEALNFRPPLGEAFCLFSIQFSPSNTHILGGASDDHVYLYNLERKERVARIPGHNDHVNAVAFADSGSQVVLSGGDDSVIKIWDLRSPDAAVGGLCGHQAGVTCITAKGDGQHFISNGKDQTMKLWDMRRMMDPNDQRMVKAANVRQWDYRHMPMSSRRPKKSKRLADYSVKTFHGHKVLQTLIRCYFSPAHTTGQRFVMSGSHDGRVCIWDIVTGKMVEGLDWHTDNTRDVSWHPHLPLIASFSWDAAVGLWGYSGADQGDG